MKAKLAESLYHGKEGYNCAQAILKTFQQEFKVDEERITEAAQKGRGRAEDGVCGALYAALQLTDDNTLKEQLNASFKTEGGSLRCKDIRIARKLSCKECVKLAAACVQEII